jgi:hypothetical protein
MTPSGTKPATFWLVVQCLNQLCYSMLHPHITSCNQPAHKRLIITMLLICNLMAPVCTCLWVAYLQPVVQEEWGGIAWLDGGSKYACISVSVFLKMWVDVLISVHIFSPFNISSDIHFHTLYAISCPWLQTTVVSYCRQCHSVGQVPCKEYSFCLVNSRQHRSSNSL